ncbi:MAG: hypothetical protein GW942_02865 [Candidatus Pacebacteria bacterium]|nr:hypothetical protein [Candidatus Paceibacterota bacterium]
MSFQLIKQAYATCETDGGVNLGCEFTLGIGGGAVKDTYGTPTDLVNPLVQNLMIAGGIILFFMFILAGFKFLQESSKAKEESMKILKAALIGFIVMFSAFWIVQIIKVITGTDISL